MTAEAKASSCLETGELDGWEVSPVFTGEMDPSGSTRLCATPPEAKLADAHQRLVDALKAPLSVLYRQKVDREDPKPQGHPGRDFVAVELDKERVLGALRATPTLHYADARAEVWVRGALGDQVVLDQDGTLYAYPDDPLFRDVLTDVGLTEAEDTFVTLEQRDYVRHWFRAAADAEERTFMEALGLAEVPVQR